MLHKGYNILINLEKLIFMPQNKNAILRYRIIDKCLTNKMRKFPSMDYIIERIEEQIHSSLSKSMFTKDIESMREIYNAPIKYIRSEKGYCYTDESFSLNSFPLTSEEIEALDFSTALFHQLKTTKMFEHFENAINKVIEGYRISKIIGKSESQILQVEEPLKSDGNVWLEIILKSITERNCIQVFYQGFGKEEKDHVFSPYLLKEYHNRWYAIGYSERAKNVLVFALDRIVNIKKYKSRYFSNNNFTSADFFKYSFGITQVHGAKPEKVELVFTNQEAPYILSQPLHHSQEIVRHDKEGLHIRLQVYLTHELVMAVLGYGKEVTVLKPALLIQQIKKEITEMNKLYQKK